MSDMKIKDILTKLPDGEFKIALERLLQDIQINFKTIAGHLPDMDDNVSTNITDIRANLEAIATNVTNISINTTAILSTELDYFLTANAEGVLANHYIMQDTVTGDPESDLTSGNLAAGSDNQLAFSYITAVGDPVFSQLSAGIYLLHSHLKKTGAKPSKFYWTLSRVDADGTSNKSILVYSDISGFISTTTQEWRLHGILSDDVSLAAGSRLLLQLYGNIGSSGANVTFTIYMEGTNNCHLSIRTSSQTFSDIFVRQDGTTPLTADWDIGNGRMIKVDTINESTGVAGITFGNIIYADANPIGLEVLRSAFVGINLEVVQNITVGGNIIGVAGKYIGINKIQAVSSAGLSLFEDDGKGIFIRDGGHIQGGSDAQGIYHSGTWNNTLNMGWGNNSNQAMIINFVGYQNGTTQFRDLYIDDGKKGVIAFFDGSTGELTIANLATGGAGRVVMADTNGKLYLA